MAKSFNLKQTLLDMAQVYFRRKQYAWAVAVIFRPPPRQFLECQDEKHSISQIPRVSFCSFGLNEHGASGCCTNKQQFPAVNNAHKAKHLSTIPVKISHF